MAKRFVSDFKKKTFGYAVQLASKETCCASLVMSQKHSSNITRMPFCKQQSRIGSNWLFCSSVPVGLLGLQSIRQSYCPVCSSGKIASVIVRFGDICQCITEQPISCKAVSYSKKDGTGNKARFGCRHCNTRKSTSAPPFPQTICSGCNA